MLDKDIKQQFDFISGKEESNSGFLDNLLKKVVASSGFAVN